MPKVSQKYRDARREQILAAGRQCFLRKGFQATSMHDLFAESGLSAGSVYRYFTSKDELILAIAEDNMRDVVQLVHELTVDQPETSLGDALAEVLEVIEGRNAESGLGGLAVQTWGEALRNPDVARRFRELLAQLRTDLAAIVTRHQAAGRLPDTVDPAAIATLVIAIVSGHILQTALAPPADGASVSDAVRAMWPVGRRPAARKRSVRS